MRKKVGRLLESARDNIFIFLLYSIFSCFIFYMGFRLIAIAPPFIKFVGLVIVVTSIYIELYFPTFWR